MWWGAARSSFFSQCSADTGSAVGEAVLGRQPAQATGESVDTVAQMGFVVLTRIPIEREPLRIDWDRLDANRRVSLHRPRVRACAA
jgi:hypothetical protein